MDSLQAG
jgi:hypothetical protein